MAAILRDEPPELSESGRSIPPALDNIVRHCLEKRPEDRFQSAKDIVFALSEASSPDVDERPAGDDLSRAPRRSASSSRPRSSLAVLAIAAAPRSAASRRGGETRADGLKRLAVLPFENLGAPEDDYFADGIADEVRGKLTSLPGLQVIARGSSTPYKKTTKTPRQIARGAERLVPPDGHGALGEERRQRAACT